MSLSRDKKRTPARRAVLPLLQRLAPIPPAEWSHLESRLRYTTLAAGEALTRAGETADTLGFVVSGLLRKTHVTARGRVVVRGFGASGAVVGAYVSLLTQTPSYLTVEAVLDSALYVLAWSELQALYDRHPCWQTVGRRFAEATLLEREARAHELLTLTAAQRFELFLETHRPLLPSLRAADIASYLGITPVSLSRLRARERRRRRD